jgi:hypothetical protein
VKLDQLEQLEQLGQLVKQVQLGQIQLSLVLLDKQEQLENKV